MMEKIPLLPILLVEIIILSFIIHAVKTPPHRHPCTDAGCEWDLPRVEFKKNKLMADSSASEYVGRNAK